MCVETAAQFQSIYDRCDTSAAAFGSYDAQRRNSSQLDDISRTADDVQKIFATPSGRGCRLGKTKKKRGLGLLWLLLT
jgi:hypothetical protein